MNCSRVEELLEEFVSGKLHKKERAEVLAHIKSCENCQTAVREERDLRRLLKQVPAQKCPNRVVHRIWKDTVGREGSLWQRLLGFSILRKEVVYRIAPAAAAAAAILFVVLIYPRPVAEESPTDVYTAEQIEEAQKGTEFALSLLMYVADRSEKNLSKRQILELLTRPIEKSLKKSLNMEKEETSHEKAQSNARIDLYAVDCWDRSGI
jgi:hypothetical protein